MDRSKQLEVWRAALVSAIPQAVAALEESQGGEPLRTFALWTDADLRYVMAAGYTATTEATYVGHHDYVARAVTEWPSEGQHSRTPSDLQAAYVDAYYAEEGDELDPGDDHRRPWKKQLFYEMVDVLHRAREAGTFEDDALLLVYVSDAGGELAKWVLDAAERLNSKERFEWWREMLGPPE